jgi:hypothetical protein
MIFLSTEWQRKQSLALAICGVAEALTQVSANAANNAVEVNLR